MLRHGVKVRPPPDQNDIMTRLSKEASKRRAYRTCTHYQKSHSNQYAVIASRRQQLNTFEHLIGP